MEAGTCHRCGARVAWVTMQGGGVLEVDPEPGPRGVIGIDSGGRGFLPAKWAKRRWADSAGPRYVCHMATCPATNRRKRKTGADV